MSKCKVFIGSQPVIIIDDGFYMVEVYTKNVKLKKDKVYIKGDYVYIYRGKIKSEKDIDGAGIYKLNNKVIFIKPKEKEKEKYSIDNINELTPSSIFDTVSENSDKFFQPDDIETINNNSDIFTPTIKPDDDFLKRIIKEAIIDKKVNLKNYKDRFPNEYALNNMKSGLNKSTKMTVTNFVKWAEVLGLDWKVIVDDSGDDKFNPLTKTIVLTNKS